MRALAFVVAGLLLNPSFAIGQIGTAFTYQGRLIEGTAPASGSFDFQMILYDASSGGSQVGPIVTVENVTVGSGLFSANLDFGAVFTGSKRWLEIGVRPGASTGAYGILSPRQELTPTPNALHASSATSATTVAGLSCSNGQVAKWSGSGWSCGADLDTTTTYFASTGLQLAGTTFSVDNAVVARKDAAAGNQAFDTNLLFLDYTNNRVGVGTNSPTSIFHVTGGSAGADGAGQNVTLVAQTGGSDGADPDDLGGDGGSIIVEPGAGGPGRNSGDILLISIGGGAASASAAGGEGSDVGIGAGGGGSSAHATNGGGGGDLNLNAGNGGTNTGGGAGGAGGNVEILAGHSGTNNAGGGLSIISGNGNGTGNGGGMLLATGFGGGTNASGGNLTIQAAGGFGSGQGGMVSIVAGGTTSGLAGEITLIPGDSTSAEDGSIQLGTSTSQSNSSEAGSIKVHVVSGDMNFAGAGDGIILRSPNGSACRLLSINDAGTLVTSVVTCP